MKPLLVFDLDDTLYPEHEFVASGFRAVGAWLAAERGIEGFEAMANALFHAGVRGCIFNDALIHLGHADDAALVRKLVAIYREHEPRISLHPDAKWALDHFRRTHELGLLTDGYLSTQRKKVLALGIQTAFAAVVYSDAFGPDHWKPSRTPYQKMMEAVGRLGSECIYVGDNPAKDFVTANELGWASIRIRRAGGEYGGHRARAGYDAQFGIESLYELEAIV